MIWILPLAVSLAIALTIAISGNFSVFAYLQSWLVVYASFYAVKKDTANTKTSFRELIFLLLLCMLLNKMIKNSVPFLVSLFYILTLFALGYFAWRVWDEFSQRK